METLKKFFSDSWAWIAGIGATIVAFFAGRATAAGPEASSPPANPTAPTNLAAADRKEGAVYEMEEIAKIDGKMVKQVASVFTIDGDKYRITGFPTEPGKGLFSRKVQRMSDAEIIETHPDTVNIVDGKLDINDEFRKDIAAVNAALKANDFTPVRIMDEVGKITAEELKETGYKGNAEDMRVVTVIGTYQDKPDTKRKIIIQTENHLTYMVGAYNKEEKPIFLHNRSYPVKRLTQVAMREGDGRSRWPSIKDMKDEAIVESMQDVINRGNDKNLDEEARIYYANHGIKGFFKEIAKGVKEKKDSLPVKGKSIDDLTENTGPLSPGNPNAALPKLAAAFNGSAPEMS